MKKKFKLSKLLTNISVFTIMLSSVMFLFLKSSLSDVNIEVEKLKRNIQTENNKIESLSMKVDELKSLANVENAIESEGLGYNSTNIKVLSKK
jgi:cell division protein FtsL